MLIGEYHHNIDEKGRLVIPSGNSKIETGDRVIVATSKKNQIRRLNEILR